jgi:TonB family protein
MRKAGMVMGLLLAVGSAWAQIGPAQPDKDGIYSHGEKLKIAKLIHGALAIPPSDPQLAGFKHVCMLRVVIGADGVPGTIEVVNEEASPYDEAAIRSVRKSQFEPGTLDKIPVPTRVLVWVPFVGGKQAPVPITRLYTQTSAKAPAPLNSVEAEYSVEGRKRHISGMVMVSVIVTEEGLPSEAHVVQSLGYGLDEKALEAVGKYRFRPALMDDTPMPVSITIEINFRI